MADDTFTCSSCNGEFRVVVGSPDTPDDSATSSSTSRRRPRRHRCDTCKERSREHAKRQKLEYSRTENSKERRKQRTDFRTSMNKRIRQLFEEEFTHNPLFSKVSHTEAWKRVIPPDGDKKVIYRWAECQMERLASTPNYFYTKPEDWSFRFDIPPSAVDMKNSRDVDVVFHYTNLRLVYSVNAVSQRPFTDTEQSRRLAGRVAFLMQKQGSDGNNDVLRHLVTYVRDKEPLADRQLLAPPVPRQIPRAARGGPTLFASNPLAARAAELAADRQVTTSRVDA